MAKRKWAFIGRRFLKCFNQIGDLIEFLDIDRKNNRIIRQNIHNDSKINEVK
jgi:hypothetical protein